VEVEVKAEESWVAERAAVKEVVAREVGRAAGRVVAERAVAD